jgi:hypothetical protein
MGSANTNMYTDSHDGNGSDTVAMIGFDMQAPFGDLSTLDGVVATITTAGFTYDQAGKTFCIDSTTMWRGENDWSFGGAVIFEQYHPTFGEGVHASNYTAGQGYCFTLAVRPYICGDINANGSITISDIVYLAGFLLHGGAAIPNPIMRANVNCSANPNPTIADLTYLVGHLFGGGPVPCANCPQ